MNYCRSSPPVCDSSGLPGSTIEEKTRCLLGWDVNRRGDYSKSKNVALRRSPTEYPYFNNGKYVRKSSNSYQSNNDNVLSATTTIQIRNLLSSASVAGISNGLAVSSSNTARAVRGDTSSVVHVVNKTVDIFERFRRQVPRLLCRSTDSNKFQLLIQTAANVIELEAKLAHLKQETVNLSSKLQPTSDDVQVCVVDDTLDDASLEMCNEINANYCRSFADTTDDMPEDLQGVDVTAFKSMVSESQIRDSY